MKPLDLPVDLLRAFLATADLGTVTAAAERIGRTQPAVSMRLRRLEELAGQALFRRCGRMLALTPAGEILREHARRMIDAHDAAVAAIAAAPLRGSIRIGVIQDVADSCLADTLGRFARLHPGVRLDLQVGGSAALRDRVATGALDLAVGLDDSGDAAAPPLPLHWLGDATLLDRSPLPLALLDAPCAFRNAALAALDAIGRPWRLAVSGPSLSGLRAAVNAGLGLTCRTPLGMAGVARVAGLPALPSTRLAVMVAPDGRSAAVEAMAELLRQELIRLP